VWCAVSSGVIIGSDFFKNKEGQTITVNAEQYTAMLEIFQQNELNLCQLNSLWFQQDGETAHSTWISMAVFREMFPDTLISCFGGHQLVTCSIDLSALDYFLWSYIKSKVYKT
jgi:hypothetical protein